MERKGAKKKLEAGGGAVPLVRLQSQRKLLKFSTTLTSFITPSIPQNSTTVAKSLQKLQLLNENRVHSAKSHLFARTRSFHRPTYSRPVRYFPRHFVAGQISTRD